MNVDGLLVETVAVRLEDAVLVLDEVEGEGLERKRCAQPDEPGRPHIEIRLESIGIAGANGAVDAVGSHDHVRVSQAQCRQVGIALQIGLESHVNIERGTSILKDVEQFPAGDAGKPVAAGGDDAAADMDVDVVPVGKAGRDALERLGIRRPEVLHRLIGEHHAPAERIVRPVAFQHRDLSVWARLLQQQRKVESGGPAANDRNLHSNASRAE
jgi:hypothetical protein